MKSSSHTLSDNVIDSRRLITGLRHALDVNYAKVLATAQTRWESAYAGNDPSDACVSVRITSGSPTAGVLRKKKGSLLHATRAALPA
jgi:hypothetical protein